MTNTIKMTDEMKCEAYSRMVDKMTQFCDDDQPDREWDMAMEVADEICPVNDIETIELLAEEIANNWSRW